MAERGFYCPRKLKIERFRKVAKMSSDKEVERVLMAFKKELLKIPGVQGVGVGLQKKDGKYTGKKVIKVYVMAKVEEKKVDPLFLIPKTLAFDGVEVETDVESSGILRPLVSEREIRIRPVKAGFSLGHFKITAGTSGELISVGGKMARDSNLHVLAPLDDCQIGDPILQPGPYDGGQQPADVVGRLAGFVKLYPLGSDCPTANFVVSLSNFLAKLAGKTTRLLPPVSTKVNEVDYAWYFPDDESQESLEIEDICPKWLRVKEPELGETVVKTGRTTGITHLFRESMGVSLNVYYGENKIVSFEGLSVLKGTDPDGSGGVLPGSKGGDSASPVGLPDGSLEEKLFAGNDSENMTICFRIKRAFELASEVTGKEVGLWLE